MKDAKDKGSPMRVMYLDHDDEWKIVKGKLMPDGMVEHKDKSWVYNQNGKTRVPSIGKKLGLTNTTHPCIVAYEENSNIFIWDDPKTEIRSRFRQDSTFNLAKFKRLHIAEHLVRESKRKPQENWVKWAVFGGMFIVLMLIVVLGYAVIGSGLLGPDFWVKR